MLIKPPSTILYIGIMKTAIYKIADDYLNWLKDNSGANSLAGQLDDFRSPEAVIAIGLMKEYKLISLRFNDDISGLVDITTNGLDCAEIGIENYIESKKEKAIPSIHVGNVFGDNANITHSDLSNNDSSRSKKTVQDSGETTTPLLTKTTKIIIAVVGFISSVITIYLFCK